ncbi:hypothetical protein BDV59DRAFT_92179 [Aspergillus ambiguus]|uniref:uncharacterized protein n=1 Tax=Aspergillus ambiguus TaxID=176160 RepID=UPI003CCDF340
MPNMARFGRPKKPPVDPHHANAAKLVSSPSDPPPRQPPRITLAHVEPLLNMHQHNGLFEADSPERPSDPSPEPNPDFLNGATSPPNGDSVLHKGPSEWSSAVGHAATGKSGRVIHNLQEDIARLTRECGVYRSRAEETQRTNEAFKIQLQNMTERLRNLEQANETNLHSIARKDKKLEELRAELQSERARRVQADGDKVKINQLLDEAADEFHRKRAELEEIAAHARAQYDVLAAHGQRDRADTQRKLAALRADFTALKQKQVEKGPQLERLEELAAQKDREIQSARERFDRLFAEYEAYRRVHDEDVSSLVEKGRRCDSRVETALATLKETEGEMKWVMRLQREAEEAS